jgi:light-regulated signal transduction histidine kinase (bacteriophytochrome)
MEAFTYSVSHDPWASLRHIERFICLFQKKEGPVFDEQSQDYMNRISKSARKMGLLIDDLLSFSRMVRHEMSFKPVDLKSLVNIVIKELAPDCAGRNIDWRIRDLAVC